MSQRNPAISKGVDWVMIWLYLLLVAIGLLSIFSVTYRDGDNVVQTFLAFKTDYSKQFYFFIVSLVLGLFILLTDSKFFTATANIWYAVGMLLLLLVFPLHTAVKGTESIIRIGGFNLQPAELMKVFVNMALAKYLSRVETDFSKPRSQLIAAALVVVPALISIAQKETGLALVFFSFFLVMFREGLPPIYLIVGFSLAVLVVATLVLDKDILAIILTAIAAGAIYLLRKQIRRRRGVLIGIVLIWVGCVGVQRFVVPFLFTKVLAKHQVERIFSLIGKENPYAALNTVEGDEDPTPVKKKDTDYNVRQSKIAIGSGGVIGKGFLKGTQTRFDFVPEQRTDFIFCTIGEGFGFAGSALVLGIYLFLLLRIVNIAERQRSVFSRCYAYGVASVFFFHIAINLCMTIGLAPVIGIPLPLISYGGTSLLSFSIMLFILIRLDADRQMVLR
ncbi:rod shape-determining protein RodA [Pseudoflavitalea sp. G-6-1-2]|uniref:rod shape-determining protein RodA n=1 Tax=Pseudoflavitalea sp. G-6-1-2 TaxID=2728841 RepID=UPI00146F4ACC|nr:rod shape-determining protein RodA [Pseudoflavitalea sp. G-6-1-2]NML19470.1 rod shape-determining protein RodA [Pseudoflavitalea sp. G-6-1-2]